jgi:enoyl-CoA hydratase/carnithine racemase
MKTDSIASDAHILARHHGRLGVLTLNRAPALNALSLGMIRELTRVLKAWEQDDTIDAVLVHGAARPGKGPAFCAGGDIRFFHEAALAGDPQLEDFFTEEYALNHLVHGYAKPSIAWMDGICMGGGMGIGQGASHRVVTEHSKLAMPETHIGLFPDVGGGWFLARCPGRLGEYLGLTGHALQAADAIASGLADIELPSSSLTQVIEALAAKPWLTMQSIADALRAHATTAPAAPAPLATHREAIDRHFAAPDLAGIAQSLRDHESAWARDTLAEMATRSPLMMAVTLEQIRRARELSLADDLRMERGLVRRCFHLRPGMASETVEGIRALAIDKDHAPHWIPAQIEHVTAEMVEAFFANPWPAAAHPLAHLR